MSESTTSNTGVHTDSACVAAGHEEPASVPDADLASFLQRVQEGDLNAFELFYLRTIRQVIPPVRHICGTAHFEDALAEAYFQAWRTVESFDPTRGSAIAWIKMIACSRARDLMRRERARHGGAEGAPDHDHQEDRDEAPGPEGRLSDAQTCAAVRAAVDALPIAQRALVSMTYYSDCNQAEIASVTGLPSAKVKGLMSAAHRRLASALVPARSSRQR